MATKAELTTGSASAATEHTEEPQLAEPKPNLHVLAHSDSPDMLLRSCVDCGLRTGCFCDHCLAEDRVPNEVWASGQHTPLCSHCDNEHNMLLRF